jgi:hypothetical protein
MMKKVLVTLVAGLTLMAGASVFARDGGGGNGGSTVHDISMAHRDAAMAAYKAKHSVQTTAQDSSAQK